VKRTFLTVCLLGAVIVSGCSSTSGSGTTSSTAVGETSTSVAGTAANDYSLIGGGAIDLTRGPTARPMALWFWAPG
jgi:hypothetical protein